MSFRERDHIKTLGTLCVAMGGLCFVFAWIALANVGGLASVLEAGIPVDTTGAVTDNAHPVPGWIAIVLVVLAGYFGVLTLPNVIGGWGLLRHKNWSRPMMVIISSFNLFVVPFGTAIGFYGLWVLFDERSRRLLGRPQHS